MQRRESVIISDARSDEHYARAYRELIGARVATEYGHVRSWMGVPMMVRERVIGALVLSMSRPGFYTQRHATLAEAIGNHAAVAIENAQLLAHARRAAVLDERQRLARELHDSISQALFGISLGAQTALAMLERDSERAVEPMRYVLELADAGAAEMRALIFELRPESLQSEGLIRAIEKRASAIRARHRLQVDLQLDDEPETSLEIKEALYRITQEAMHNTVKHAGARTIIVRLICHDGSICLEIIDDGRGFDTAASFPGHLGLRSMPERARALGGVFTIDSSVGGGTRISVAIPVRPPVPIT